MQNRKTINIRIEKRILEKLKKEKLTKRETYSNIIERLFLVIEYLEEKGFGGTHGKPVENEKI